MRILVPVDASTSCQAAISVAFQLARAVDGAELEALHVVNVRPASGRLLADLSGYVGFEPAIVSDAVFSAHTEAGEALVKAFQARATASGVSAAGRVETGAVAATLIQASLHADLVIMGLKGESDDRFPGQGGAQSANAVPQLNAPVLLVPRTVTRVAAIAVGYDGSASAAHALKHARSLAAPLEVPVHLIHVGDPSVGEPLLDEAVALLAPIPCVKHLVEGGPVHELLSDTAVESGADVLVLGFAGRSKMKDVLWGSTRDHLLGKSRIALLLSH